MSTQQKIGIYFKLKPGTRDEYKKRHDEIWPEMTEALKDAGICNYSIWNHENMLFSYFEVEDYEIAQQKLNSNHVFIKWRKYMEDIIDFDEQTRQKEWIMDLMFYHP